jgi:hypothetical protein
MKKVTKRSLCKSDDQDLLEPKKYRRLVDYSDSSGNDSDSDESASDDDQNRVIEFRRKFRELNFISLKLFLS